MRYLHWVPVLKIPRLVLMRVEVASINHLELVMTGGVGFQSGPESDELPKVLGREFSGKVKPHTQH